MIHYVPTVGLADMHALFKKFKYRERNYASMDMGEVLESLRIANFAIDNRTFIRHCNHVQPKDDHMWVQL